jgi:RNA polymerase sigma-70 factor (ECF subfamily)
MEDKQIVDLYWQRSEQAITETDIKYGRYCHYIAYQILKDGQNAQEIVNDTYWRVWNSIPPHRPDPLKPYVGTVSRRLSLDRFDYENAQKRCDRVGRVIQELSECVNDGSAPDLDQSLAIRDALNSFLFSLPRKTRNIFVRRYWYTSSITEIAQEFAMKESAVGMSLQRSRKKLRLHLLKEGITL